MPPTPEERFRQLAEMEGGMPASTGRRMNHEVDYNLYFPIRLLTAADLAVLPDELPSGSVRYELNDGRLVIQSPSTDEHAVSQARVCAALSRSAESRGLGETLASVGIVLRRNPDRVVGADAAFILSASLPVRRSPEGYLETIPEIVIEVRSPNDTGPEITAKNEESFAAGVRVVWLLDPTARTVALHNADGSVQLFRDSDALTCPPVARLLRPRRQLVRRRVRSVTSAGWRTPAPSTARPCRSSPPPRRCA